MVGELRLGGEVQRFEHDAVGVGAVAGEAAHHAVVAEVAAGQGRAGGDRHAAADDGVGAEMADGKVGDVHRAAAAATIAFVLAEQLADRPVDMLFERRLDQLLAAVGAAAGHARAKRLFIHRADGDGALGQALAVAAVGAGDVVGDAQRRAGAGGRSFLADRDVRRAAIIVIANGIVSAGTQLDDHLLEFADDQHVFEDRDRFRGGQRIGRELRPKAALIAVSGDLAAIDHERIEPRPHVAQIRARFDRHLVALSSLQARATGTRDPPGPL